MLLPDAWDFVEYWAEMPDRESLPLLDFKGISSEDYDRRVGLPRRKRRVVSVCLGKRIIDWETSRFVPSSHHLRKICIKFACPYWCLIIPKHNVKW